MADVRVSIFRQDDVNLNAQHRHLSRFLRYYLFSILARMLEKLYHEDQVPYIYFEVCQLVFQVLDHNLEDSDSHLYSLRYRLRHGNLQSLKYRYSVNLLGDIEQTPYHEVVHHDDTP